MTSALESISRESIPPKSKSLIVCDVLRRRIVDGSLKSGDRLPSESELSKALHVSRNTLREALNILGQEGSVIRRQGIGTFVTSGHLLQNRLDINYGVTELISSMGLKAGVGKVEMEVVPADEQLAGLLDVPVESRILRVERVRTANGKPVVFSVDFVPESIIYREAVDLSLSKFEGLLRREMSLYSILKEHAGLVVDYGVAKMKPTQANAELARALGIEVGDLMMSLEQVDYESGGTPLMLSVEYHIADVYVFTVFRKRHDRA